MAWRPYQNLIDAKLDNQKPGQVSGWMRFFRRRMSPLRVTFDLKGDFHEDIRGKVIRLSNPDPSDENTGRDGGGTYMEGFGAKQEGDVGDITAGLPLGPWTQKLAQQLMEQNELIWDEQGLQGTAREQQRREWAERYRKHIEAQDLFYPYVSYPYLEWYSAANGRVVLELEPSQVEVIEGSESPKAKDPKALVADKRRREKALLGHLAHLMHQLSRMNREHGGDGNVFGALV